jgi:hypothetical protein
MRGRGARTSWDPRGLGVIWVRGFVVGVGVWIGIGIGTWRRSVPVMVRRMG